MVDLNLTFFVELGLYLAFLWLMSRLVFGPVLKIMDEREEQLGRDEESAQTDNDKAASLEGEYNTSIAATRRETTVQAEQARREAQQQRAAKTAERRKDADKQVAVVRGTAVEQVQAERTTYDAQVPSLVDAIVRQFRLGGPGS